MKVNPKSEFRIDHYFINIPLLSKHHNINFYVKWTFQMDFYSSSDI